MVTWVLTRPRRLGSHWQRRWNELGARQTVYLPQRTRGSSRRGTVESSRSNGRRRRRMRRRRTKERRVAPPHGQGVRQTVYLPRRIRGSGRRGTARSCWLSGSERSHGAVATKKPGLSSFLPFDGNVAGTEYQNIKLAVKATTTPVSNFKAPANLLPLDELLKL